MSRGLKLLTAIDRSADLYFKLLELKFEVCERAQQLEEAEYEAEEYTQPGGLEGGLESQTG